MDFPSPTRREAIEIALRKKFTTVYYHMRLKNQPPEVVLITRKLFNELFISVRDIANGKELKIARLEQLNCLTHEWADIRSFALRERVDSVPLESVEIHEEKDNKDIRSPQGYQETLLPSLISCLSSVDQAFQALICFICFIATCSKQLIAYMMNRMNFFAREKKESVEDVAIVAPTEENTTAKTASHQIVPGVPVSDSAEVVVNGFSCSLELNSEGDLRVHLDETCTKNTQLCLCESRFWSATELNEHLRLCPSHTMRATINNLNTLRAGLRFADPVVEECGDPPMKIHGDLTQIKTEPDDERRTLRGQSRKG
ncbi:hypothetical protein EJ08DRAFT_691439 [Tothia fuscella]|uniref:Uncharacterized protein n=1 Tax=Tothia fuscella TaxID=1048955 RepID=A0A9P4P2L1_9PEZI|nr:hypothetical protein EJ08DRAFT_691439 [Tothia fuscella]